MKSWFITLVLIMLSTAAWAQYANPEVLKRTGSHMKLDGVKLTADEQAALLADIDGTDYTKAWHSASVMRGTGMGLAIGGTAVAAGGMVTTFIGLLVTVVGAGAGAVVGSIGGEESAENAAQQGAQAGSPYITGGLIATGVGLAAVGTGIPLWVIGGTRMSKITDSFNQSQRSTAQLTFGSTPSGVGLSLRF